MPNLVGTGLNQVPTNSMLGGLAYQDPEHASIKDLDLKNLSQINSELADNAYHLFVYDTRKDSDGGAWRKRTQHTSWYNETLNTSTRGSRREFPAIAVIVAESNKITIYDGDDPDLPMWMVFNPNGIIDWATSTLGRIKVTALNGIMGIATNDGGNLTKFVEDYIDIMYSSANYNVTTGRTIADRNNATSYNTGSNNATRVFKLVHYDLHDIAMKVFPNAPIDSATGLPTPTVAVATANGVSVIKDDGNVYDTNDGAGSRPATDIVFRGSTITWMNAANGTVQNRWDIDTISSDTYGDPYVWRYDVTVNGGDAAVESTTGILWGGTIRLASDPNDFSKLFVGTSNPNSSWRGPQNGVSLIVDEIDRNVSGGSADSVTDSRSAFVGSDYNTGYMFGDCKGAFCADTTTGSISTNEYAGGIFTSNINGWTGNSNSTLSNVGGALRVLSASSGTWSGANAMYQMGNTFVVGRTYSVSWNMRVGGTTGNYSSGIGCRIQKDTSFHSTNTLITYGMYPASTNLPTSSWQGYTFTFVAERTTYGIEFFNWYGVVNNYFEVDDVIVKEAVAERSVHGGRSLNVNANTTNGLTAFGTLTKSPVAPGAELTAYSGFNSTSNLRQPPNGNMNLGTNDAYIMIWYKTTATPTNQMLMSYEGGAVGTNDYGKPFNLRMHQGTLTGWASHNNFSTYDTASHDVSTADGQWHCGVWLRRGQVFELYVDGELVDTATGAVGSNALSDVNTELVVGGRKRGQYQGNCEEPFTGSLSLARIGHAAPSAEVIKKMYVEEKHLFQPNAKATLYGSSDAITAIDYDNSTDILHVGTSAGRSEFQGLCRINNTTTAVTTVISSSDGFVAEQ